MPGKWVLRGQPALLDLSSQQHGKEASYHSAVSFNTELPGQQQQRDPGCLPDATDLIVVDPRQQKGRRIVTESTFASVDRLAWAKSRVLGLWRIDF